MAKVKKKKDESYLQPRLYWFQDDIPITMGVDSLMFRTGKMLVEAYYNGYLNGMQPDPNDIGRWSAIYEWGVVNEKNHTIPLTAFAFKISDSPYETISRGRLAARNPVTHIIPKKETKLNKKAAENVLALTALHKTPTMLATLTAPTNILKHEFSPGGRMPPQFIRDTAPLQPPPPKQSPPPTL